MVFPVFTDVSVEDLEEVNQIAREEEKVLHVYLDSLESRDVKNDYVPRPIAPSDRWEEFRWTLTVASHSVGHYF